MREVHISKRDLRKARVVDVTPPALAEGAVRLELDLFALTANNITYAAMGEGVLGYWDFFPGPEGWGRPPAWGFATVARSNAPGIEIGQRFYGYFPIAESLDVTPTKVGPGGFTDGAAHRARKAAVYNRYLNTASDPVYDPAFEPEQTLFRPLYATGWWAADCVQRGATRTVVVSSASSKTALATAHRLRGLGDAELVGLTSPRNETHVRATGLYHRVVVYDALGALTAAAPVTVLDFLGREEVLATAHRTLGAGLARSILIGATDWADKPGGVRPPSTSLVGPEPEFFFVPAYAAGRLETEPELGAAMLRDLRAFYPISRAWVTPRRFSGAEAILDCWARLAAGEAPANEGWVLSF